MMSTGSITAGVDRRTPGSFVGDRKFLVQIRARQRHEYADPVQEWVLWKAISSHVAPFSAVDLHLSNQSFQSGSPRQPTEESTAARGGHFACRLYCSKAIERSVTGSFGCRRKGDMRTGPAATPAGSPGGSPWRPQNRSR